MKKEDKSKTYTDLRQKAEETLKKKPLKTGSQLSVVEMLKLIHELEVHQVELEMQNEELMMVKAQAEVATEKYTELFDFTALGYFTLSNEGEIIEINLSGANMIGIERTHLKSRPLSFFVSESTKSVFNLFLGKVFNSKTKETCEVTLSSNGNLPKHVYLTSKATENGEQCLVTMFDLTLLKQAEKQITKLSNAVEQAADIIFITSKEGIIEYINPAFETITGYSKEEALGNTPRILKSGLMGKQYYHRVWATILSGNVLRGEVMNRNKNGEIFFYDQTITPLIGVNGEVTHFISTGKDITERKRAEILLQEKNEALTKTNEELIKAKEKAEESDRLKSAFLANMSHEIRTPMNGILGFAELLKEPKLTGEEQQEYISIIEESGARMLNIINDIMIISKVDSGLMNLSISERNMNEKMESIFTLFKPEAEGKGLQILFKNGLPANEAIIKIDREKVYVILTKLINNAIKFTHAGTIEFGYEKKVNRLEFYVKDTGIGIRPEQKEFIFERFRQVSESYNRDYEGAGLGLPISKAYVEMLGGKIWVESEYGKGTVFYFTIPYNDEAEEKNVNKNTVLEDLADNQIKSLKILIAEDDNISKKLIEIAINKFSTEVWEVRTGIEAVEACHNRPDIDLVLMDIQMPDMDGYEATRQIRQFNKDIIIIAQTAFALSGDRNKAMAAGCNDYISKPIDKALLTEIIKRHFTK